MSHLYDALQDFVKGDTTATRVSFLDSEGIVRIKIVNEKNLGKSLVHLNFSSEEYVNLFVPEDGWSNNEYLMNLTFGSGYYGGHIFIDTYTVDNDWDEGYGLQNFNEENLSKVKEILTLLRPELSNTDLRTTNDSDVVEVCNFLRQEFDNEIDQIIYEYTDYYDSALVEGMKRFVRGSLCKKFTDFNLFEKECGRVYMTTVSVLISLWDKSKSSKDDTLTDVLKSIVQQNNLQFDEDLYEDYYSYYDSENFDDEGYNREVGRQLDKILNEIEEGDNFQKYKNNAELYEKLSKLKYNKFDKWYEFPKQKSFGEKSTARFKIVGIRDGKIHVQRYDGPTTNEFLDYESFLNFLYHPELF